MGATTTPETSMESRSLVTKKDVYFPFDYAGTISIHKCAPNMFLKNVVTTKITDFNVALNVTNNATN